MPPATLQHARRPADQRRGRRAHGGDTTNQTSNVPVITYPGVNLGIKVYIAPGANPMADPATWAWTDITKYVLWANRIVIVRGRQDEQSQVNPSTCSLTLKNYALPPYNVAGIFNPRNPLGPWFGQLGRNTPIRVDVDPGTGPRTRFVGFVPSWPPRSDVTGQYKYSPIVAAGVLRRLGQATTPLKSTMERSILASGPAAYWPLEDGSTATAAASGLPLGSSLVAFGTSGTVTFAAATPAAGAVTAPDLTTGGRLTGPFPTSAATAWTIEFSANCALAPFGVPISMTMTGSTYNQVWVYTQVDGTTGVQVYGRNSSGSSVLASFSPLTNYAGVWHHYRLTAQQVGADAKFELFIDGVSSGVTTWVSVTLGNPQSLVINPGPIGSSGPDTSISSVNHFAFYAQVMATSHASALTAYAGESATARFTRVCGEENVSAAASISASPVVMGPQPVDTLLAVLGEAEAAANGVKAETRGGQMELYVPAGFENNPIALTIDNSLKQLSPDFLPIDDDQRTRNHIVASRANGSSVVATDSTGPLGTGIVNGAATGTGVGVYDQSVNVNVQTDGLLVFQASHRLVQGTVDESRYPSVRLNFSRTECATLITPWLACDIGSRIMITHPPADLPPDRIDQVLEGYTESFDQRVWDVELNLSPFSPHRIFRTAAAALDADEFLGYLIPTTCTLAAALTDTTGTSVSITSDVLWSTNGDDWTPAVPVRVDGEIMMVSAVSGGANPQTLTVTRGAMDTAAATHLINASLAFATPGVLGL